MSKDVEVLNDFVKQLLKAQQPSPICVNELNDQYKPLAKNLYVLSHYLMEVQEATMQIASGNVNSYLNKYNPYAGALKDLQSSFYHLTWQIERVALGDFAQRVDYLGSISEAFNQMVEQLQERQMLMVDNIALTKKIAEQQTALLEKEIENQVEHYRQLSNSVKEIQKYRHDMRNHLLCIDALIREHKIEDTRAYIHDLYKVFPSHKELVCDKNYILNSLLNEKLDQAKTLNTMIHSSVEIAKELKISNLDWCILYGNALDNALEALTKVPKNERKLNIKIKNIGNMLITTIVNSMVGDLVYDEHHKLKTSKEDETLHGIGLKNINACVKKYDGELSIESNGIQFTLTFLLCDV